MQSLWQAYLAIQMNLGWVSVFVLPPFLAFHFLRNRWNRSFVMSALGSGTVFSVIYFNLA